MKKLSYVLLRILPLALVTGLSSSSIWANTIEWMNIGTAYDTSSNWNAAPTYGTAGDTSYYNGVALTNPTLTTAQKNGGIYISGTGYNLSSTGTGSLSLTNAGTGTSTALNYYTVGSSNTISARLILASTSSGSTISVYPVTGNLTISGDIGQSGGGVVGANNSFNKNGSGTLTLSGNNTFTGYGGGANSQVNVNSNTALGVGAVTWGSSTGNFYALGNTSGGTITIANAVTTANNSGLYYNSANNLVMSGTVTLGGGYSYYVTGAGSLTFGNTVSGAQTLTKNGTGTLVLGGSNSYTGLTTVTLGTVVLDKNLGGSMVSTNALTLGGGKFVYKGASSGSSAQSLTGTTTFNAGNNRIVVDANGGSGTTLTLGTTWTRGSGGTLNIDLTSAGSALALNATPALTNSLWGSSAAGRGATTVTDGTGTGFATLSGSNVVRYTGATTLTSASTSSSTNFVTKASDVGYTGGTLTMAGSAATNTLQLDGSAGNGVLDLNAGTLSMTSEGLLMTGTGNYTIQNGQLGGTTTGLSIHQFGTGTLTISSNITNGGTLAKDGSGTLVISGTTGTALTNAYINEGTVNVTGQFGKATGGSVYTVSGGTLSLQSASGLGSGTLTIQGDGTLNETVTNAISGTTALVVNGSAATANLSQANNYSGATTLTTGTVSLGDKGAFGSSVVTMSGVSISASSNLSGANAINNTYVFDTISSNRLTFTGSNNIEFSGNGSLNADKNIINNIGGGSSLKLSGPLALGTRALGLYGTGDTAISGNVSGTGSLLHYSTGTTTLSGSNTYSGATSVSAGVLLLNSANALPGGIGTSGGLSNLIMGGGVIGLGNGDFTRGLGTGVTQVQWTTSGTAFASGGFAAFGANRVVNLGGASATVQWTQGSFVGNGSDLILGASTADSMVDFQNPIDLFGAARIVRVENGSAAIDARLSGRLSNGSFVKTGTGTLELTASNTYTGGTFVGGGGTLQVGTTGSINSTSGVSFIGTGNTFNYSGGAALSKNVSLTTGNTFKYNSSAQYTGTLTFTGGTLGGSGNMSGTAVTIGAGQTLSPGNSPGTLSTGTQTWSNGGTYLWEINSLTGTAGSDPGWDLAAISGDLNTGGLSTGGFTLAIDSLNALTGWDNTTTQTWTIATVTGAINGFSNSNFNFDYSAFADQNALGGGSFSLQTSGTNLNLVFTAAVVPEPSSFALMGVGLLAMGVVVRRRNRA